MPLVWFLLHLVLYLLSRRRWRSRCCWPRRWHCHRRCYILFGDGEVTADILEYNVLNHPPLCEFLFPLPPGLHALFFTITLQNVCFFRSTNEKEQERLTVRSASSFSSSSSSSSSALSRLLLLTFSSLLCTCMPPPQAPRSCPLLQVLEPLLHLILLLLVPPRNRPHVPYKPCMLQFHLCNS